MALGRCLGPTVVLYKAEGWQGADEDFLSSVCLLAFALLQTHCSRQNTVLREPRKAVVQLCSLVSQQVIDLTAAFCPARGFPSLAVLTTPAAPGAASAASLCSG